jgi:hypothetical protein
MTNKLINSYNFRCAQNNQATCVTSFTIYNNKHCDEEMSKMDVEEVKIPETRAIFVEDKGTGEPEKQHTDSHSNKAPDTEDHHTTDNEERVYGINKSLIREENNLPDKRRNSHDHPEKKSAETSKKGFNFRGGFLWQSRETLKDSD